MIKEFELEKSKEEYFYNVYSTLRLCINPKDFVDVETEEQLIKEVKTIFWDAYGAEDEEFKSVEIPDEFIEEWHKLRKECTTI